MKVLKVTEKYKGYSSISEYELKNKATGQIIKRELLSRGSSVTVLVFDPVNELFLLASEFRIGEIKYRTNSFGLIAGMIDGDESFDLAASREIQEECGLTINPQEISLLDKCFTSPGITNEESFLCYARADLSNIDTDKSYGATEEGEYIKLFVHNYSDLPDIIRENDFSGSSLLLLMKYKNNLLK